MKYQRYIKPMLATLAEEAFDDRDWIFEIKWDGYRAIAEVGRNAVKLYSRNGLSFASDFPEIVTELRKLAVPAVLDGEIVALDTRQRPQFQLLQQRKDNPSTTLCYYAFDLLSLDGQDIRKHPLIERKKLLKTLLGRRAPSVVKFSDHVRGDGRAMFRDVGRKDLEGIVAKRLDSPYRSGLRTGDWLKIKHHQGQEVVICGFTPPKGGRMYFGALVLGVYDHRKLTYVGNAGTGFSEETLEMLYGEMKRLIVSRSPFREAIGPKSPTTWVRPELVANVKFSEWTSGGSMRHPVFLGLRVDKKAKDVHRETA